MTATERGGPDRDDFYRLTGEVIREWANLELALSKWLIDLLEIDALRSRLLWDSYGDLRSKLNLLKTLTRNFASESLWPDAKEIFAVVEKIAGNRYILPHAFGQVDAAARRLSFFSEKADGDFVVDFVGERSVDTDVLKEWLDDMSRIQDRIEDFTGRLGGSVYEESLMHRRLSAAG